MAGEDVPRKALLRGVIGVGDATIGDGFYMLICSGVVLFRLYLGYTFPWLFIFLTGAWSYCGAYLRPT